MMPIYLLFISMGKEIEGLGIRREGYRIKKIIRRDMLVFGKVLL